MNPASASRWGPTDERGAYNLIDAAATLRGLQSVREGRVVSLAVPIKGGTRGPGVPSRQPAQHFMTRAGGDYCCGSVTERDGFGFSDDVILMPTHGTTHIDALAHVWRNGMMYNGFTAADVSGRGAKRCGIDKLGPIATRAIFVDLADGPAGHRIGVGTLQDAVAATGVTPEPGDALLVRTGWMTAYKEGTADPFLTAGLGADCGDWIAEQGFALVAADNVAVEVLPSGDADCAVPLHIRLIRDEGIYLCELLDLDMLALAERGSMLLVIAPLPIAGGVGSPINPVVIL